MLQSFRGFAGSWIIKILFVLLILSFAAWGIEDVFRSAGTSSTVAKVGEVEIDRAELDSEFRRQMERLRPILGNNLTTEQARQFGLLDQSLNGLIQQSLYDQASRDLGIRVGTELVQMRIVEEPAFRNQAGQFDPNQYREALRNAQLTEAAYVAAITRETARELVISSVGSGATTPASLVNDLYRYRGERRQAELITLPNSVAGDVATPDDAALLRYYEDHQVQFTAPEYRELTVAQLVPATIAADIPVTDQELRDAYSQRENDFGTPERRSIDMVVTGNEAQAKAIRDATLAGKTLADAAKEVGLDVSNFQDISRNELPEIGDAAFALAKDTVSEPVQSMLGWHLMLVTDIKEGAVKSFDDVRDQLSTDLKLEKALDSVFSIANQAEDQLASGAPLEEVANALKLQLTVIPATDAQGRKADGTEAAPGLANGEAAIKTGYELASGTSSPLIETADHSFYAVRVNTITPAAPRPLDSVRDQVIAGWKDAESARIAAERAKELADKLKGAGEGAADLAAASGASFAVTAPFRRDDRGVEGLPADLVVRLFAVTPGEVVLGSAPDAQIIARLKSIEPVDPVAATSGDAAEALAATRNAVAQSLSADLLAQFGEALRQRYPVVIHRNRINQFFAEN